MALTTISQQAKAKTERQRMPKMNKSWFTLSNQGEEQPVKVWVHGDIGSYDIEAIDLVRALQAVGSQDAEFRIQSYGGSVYEGLAMYNAIKAHKGNTVGVVDGLVASISSYFLMACDVVKMPENAKLMIHNPSIGAWGGEDELDSALTQLKNAKQTIADAYVERCGKPLDDVLAAMAKETWFTAQEALEFGLIDEIVDPVNLSNSLKGVSLDDLQAKAFKHPPEDLLNQLESPLPKPEQDPLLDSTSIDDEPQPLAASAAGSEQSQQVSDDMPKPLDNDVLQNAVKKENARQSAIRALCAQHKVSDELCDEMLNDMDCSEEKASLKILQNLGTLSAQGSADNTKADHTQDGNESMGLTNTHIHVDNGNVTKDSLQNALNSRCGTESVEKDNPYRMKTLLDMAEISVGKDAKFCSNKNELVARAFNSGDFADIITEGVRTVIRLSSLLLMVIVQVSDSQASLKKALVIMTIQ
jgi:ATP-dependent Clp endopeptidase proteolytic subunit ClpP